jgi:hypothetical protein
MYRSIETAMWDDPWFAELPPNAKLLFVYLITNRRATACGVFEIQRRALVFETGLSGDAVKEAIDALERKVTWWGDHQIIWVHNFYRRQRANTGPSFTVSAKNALANYPSDVQATVLAEYPELGETPPDPTPTPSKVKTPTSHPNGRVPAPTPEASSTVAVPTGHRLTVTEEVTGTGTAEREEKRACAAAPATPSAVSPKQHRKKPKIPIPEPFIVTEAMFAWADEMGFTDAFVRDATEYFVRWAKSHDHRYADWEMVWQNVLDGRWKERHGGKIVPIRSAS